MNIICHKNVNSIKNFLTRRIFHKTRNKNLNGIQFSFHGIEKLIKNNINTFNGISMAGEKVILANKIGSALICVSFLAIIV